jgi:hypothetical protein
MMGDMAKRGRGGGRRYRRDWHGRFASGGGGGRGSRGGKKVLAIRQVGPAKTKYVSLNSKGRQTSVSTNVKPKGWGRAGSTAGAKVYKSVIPFNRRGQVTQVRGYKQGGYSITTVPVRFSKVRVRAGG